MAFSALSSGQSASRATSAHTSLIEATRQRLGGNGNVGLAEIVPAFRGSKHLLKGDGMRKRRKTEPSLGTSAGSSKGAVEPALGSSRSANEPNDCSSKQDTPDDALVVFCETLRLQGYPEIDITDALQECGVDVHRAADFCIRRADGVELNDISGRTSYADSCLHLMTDMGFRVDDITVALEACEFDFCRAFRFLTHTVAIDSAGVGDQFCQ